MNMKLQQEERDVLIAEVGGRNIRMTGHVVYVFSILAVVVAFLIAHFLLSESFSPVETVGVAMVIAGVILIVRKPKGVRPRR